VFSLPKAGNSPEDYEDAFWPDRSICQTAPRFSFAIADGATETSFAGLWARMLVRAWCRGALSKRRMFASLPALQRTWLQTVQTRPLPWYAEEKLRSGAFSSLLGFTVREVPEGGDRIWEALAVGDSCLVQVRDDGVITSFPLTKAEAFDSRPVLLSSNHEGNRHLPEHISHLSGHWEPGDVFYLMTDALACWFLRSVETDGDPCTIMQDLLSQHGDDSFSCLVGDLRGTRQMRNDDVTLLAVALE
jgi:hypothetical protein